MDCVILGNGPSLLTAQLPDLPTFGCNYIGLLLQPTYYVAIDKTVIANDDLIFPTARDAKIAFLRNFNSQDAHPHPLYDLPNVQLVTRKSHVFKGESTVTGSSSVYLMLKLAYYMDFDTVYLYGVDHTEKHFSDKWIEGVKPCLIAREKHYKIAQAEYTKAGKKIINRSAPSILDSIFSVS